MTKPKWSLSKRTKLIATLAYIGMNSRLIFGMRIEDLFWYIFLIIRSSSVSVEANKPMFKKIITLAIKNSMSEDAIIYKVKRRQPNE